uniref:FBD domain-containing protein n=1 Tax=Opuntia streptacantha TaxID=393608 RepID=A0A7C9EVK5_OPUST
MVRDLMENVRHVRNLTLGTWIVQHLVRCSISMQKCLVLEVDLHPFDLPGIDMLLRSSAILETFVIDLSRPHAYEQMNNFGELSDLMAGTSGLQRACFRSA